MQARGTEQTTDGIEIVGREREVAALRLLVDALPAGSVALIEGEAGIGKSTLLTMARRRAEAAGIEVAHADADELTTLRPLGLLSDSLGVSLRHLARDGQIADPDQIVEAIERRSAGRPLLLALDDLQWADRLSLVALGSVVRRLLPAGVSLVAAMRPLPRSAELDAFIERVSRIRPVHLRIQTLTDLEAVALAEVSLGRALSDPERQSIGRASGNPFYICELAAAARDDGAAGIGSSTPEELHATVIRRLRAVHEEALPLLQIASLMGRSFDLGPATEVADLRPRLVDDVIGLATAAGFLEHDAGPEMPGRTEGALNSGDTGRSVRTVFRHDLVREALVASLHESVRRRLHRAIANALMGRGHGAAVVATHLLASDPNPSDAAILVHAARTVSPDQSLLFLDRAIQLIEPGASAHDEARAERAEKLLWAGRADDAIGEARRLIAEFDHTKFDHTEFDRAAHPRERRATLVDGLRTVVAHALFVLGRAHEAVDTWERIGPEHAALLRAGEEAEISFACLFAGRLRDAEAGARRALELCDQAAGEPTTSTGEVATVRCIASLVTGWVVGAGGDLAEGLRHLDQAVALAPHAGVSARRIGPHLIRGTFLESAGRTDDALRALAEDERSHDDDGYLVRAPFRHALTSVIRYHQGRWDEAAAEVDAGLSAAEDLDVRVVDGWLRAVGALIAVERGAIEQAAALLQNAGAVQLGSDWLVYASAMVAEARGDIATALSMLSLVVDVAEAVGSRTSLVLVAPDLARLAMQHRADDAQDRVRRAVSWISEDAPFPLAAARQWTMGLLEGRGQDVLAAARLLRSRPVQSARAVVDAVRLFTGGQPGEETGRPIGNEIGDAKELAVDALRVFDELGADRLTRETTVVLQAAGVRVGARRRRSPARLGWEAVTATERQVLDLLATGLSNVEIAERLFVSRRTVESHLAHVYTKVGITSRVALVRHLLTNR